ncbi:MAG: hypothetical protein OJF49_002111 [Ktedonobacterales bacterium]|nr:MAG: hypothetical protein OJF49_002111 [Ktedonobacterales bacterium]
MHPSSDPRPPAPPSHDAYPSPPASPAGPYPYPPDAPTVAPYAAASTPLYPYSYATPSQPYAPTLPGLLPPPPPAPIMYQQMPPLPAQAAVKARRVRTWYAVLALFFLAPMVGEMLSGSTPPAQFINPAMALYLATFYGSGAILIRELARRRGLGWANILLLGAAYGILEEGLTVTSWFNPYWPDVLSLHGYSRLLHTNWFWAQSLTMYHAVVSITIPIILAEAIFPRIASRPWLRRRGFVGFVILLSISSLFTLLLFGFTAFRKQGYTHPPAAYLIALALAVGLVIVGLRYSQPHADRPPVPEMRAVPGVWKLRLTALGATMLFFLISWGLWQAFNWPVIPMLMLAGLGFVAARRVGAWSRRTGWGARQRLALATGVMSFFVLLAPIIEVMHPGEKNTTGMTFVALLWLAGMIALSVATARRERRQGQRQGA